MQFYIFIILFCSGRPALAERVLRFRDLQKNASLDIGVPWMEENDEGADEVWSKKNFDQIIR